MRIVLTVKCAQAGYGYWGRNLMRCFSSARNCELTVCCEPETNLHDQIRSQYPNVRNIDINLETTLERPEIEAVILATPAALHHQQVKCCLEAGKHVFVEKPLATSTKQCEELVSLADGKGLTLMVGHTFLYNDAVRWIKNFIDQGELGNVQYIYFQRLALGRVRKDVNVLWNLAPHDVSIALYWLGEFPREVLSTGQDFLQSGIDDISFLNMKFPSGRFVQVHVSWLDPSKTRKAVVVGSRKMLVYDDCSPDQKITVYDKGFDVDGKPQDIGSRPFDSFGDFSLIQRVGDISIPRISFREPLQVEAQHFVDSVTTGGKPLSDGRSGAGVVAVLEAASDSRRRKAAVELSSLSL